MIDILSPLAAEQPGENKTNFMNISYQHTDQRTFIIANALLFFHFTVVPVPSYFFHGNMEIYLSIFLIAGCQNLAGLGLRSRVFSFPILDGIHRSFTFSLFFFHQSIVLRLVVSYEKSEVQFTNTAQPSRIVHHRNHVSRN